MINLTTDKIMRYLERIGEQRKKCTKRYGWMENVRYIEEQQYILMFLWLTGCIDYVEHKKLSKKLKVTNKDLRKTIYAGDILSEEIFGTQDVEDAIGGGAYGGALHPVST